MLQSLSGRCGMEPMAVGSEDRIADGVAVVVVCAEATGPMLMGMGGMGSEPRVVPKVPVGEEVVRAERVTGVSASPSDSVLMRRGKDDDEDEDDEDDDEDEKDEDEDEAGDEEDEPAGKGGRPAMGAWCTSGYGGGACLRTEASVACLKRACCWCGRGSGAGKDTGEATGRGAGRGEDSGHGCESGSASGERACGLSSAAALSCGGGGGGGGAYGWCAWVRAWAW